MKLAEKYWTAPSNLVNGYLRREQPKKGVAKEEKVVMVPEIRKGKIVRWVRL